MTTIITAEEPVEAPESGDWFIDHVSAWHESADDHRHDPGWFHPSDLGIASDEELLAAFRGERVKEPFSARQLRIFDMGHNRDLAWKGYLAAAGLSRCASNDERRVTFPHLRLRGECDDVVRNPLNGELFVFEFKTKNGFAWTQLRAPDPAHVVQVHPYMAGFAIYQTVIVYECKNTQATKRFFIDFDADVWRGIQQRLLGLLDLTCRCNGCTATSHVPGGLCVNQRDQGRFIGSRCAPCAQDEIPRIAVQAERPMA